MKISVEIMLILFLLINILNSRLIIASVCLVTHQPSMLHVTLDAMSSVKHVVELGILNVHPVKMDIIYQAQHVFQATLGDPTGSEDKDQAEEPQMQMGLQIHVGL